jgi:hypothetical protein
MLNHRKPRPLGLPGFPLKKGEDFQVFLKKRKIIVDNKISFKKYKKIQIV